MTTEDLEKLSAYARKVIEAKGYTFYRAVYEQGIKDAERFYGVAGRIDGMKQDQSTDLNPKKPMNGDQILEGFQATGFSGENFRLRCFNEGVRFAEKHHGIGGEDE